MSTPPPTPLLPDRGVRPVRSDRWEVRQELRADRRAAAWLALALALIGVPAGLVWWALAPRAEFRITADGPVVVGSPSAELLVADDAIFILVMAVIGLLAGLAAWPLRRHRGVTLLAGLAVGATAAGAIAWLVGELLGEGPTEAQLSDVGGVVTTGLDLGATAALAVAPFLAVLIYLIGVVVNADDGLGRMDASSSPSGGSP